MRVIVTRPETDAHAWVDAIQNAGFDAVHMPLVEIGPAPDLVPLAHAWQQWLRWQAVMFVSAQAVRMFFAQRPRTVAIEQLSKSRCWATGLGTRHALLQAGVPGSMIDGPSATSAQFDSEALWQVVKPTLQAQTPVLIVRGYEESTEAIPIKGVGRDWLAQQIIAEGAAVEFVVAYSRRPPQWNAAQMQLATQASCDGSVWCFSSSQAIWHLQSLLPNVHWNQGRCLATHPRIAQTAKDIGFREAHQSRPVLADVVASLESLA